MASFMNIKGASKASGLSPDTIRYYERAGVLPSAPRAGNGYRQYTAEHVRTLRFARTLRRLGVPLSETAALLAVFHEGTCREMQSALLATATEGLVRLDDQRREIEETERHLRLIVRELERVEGDNRPASGRVPCSCIGALARPPAEASP